MTENMQASRTQSRQAVMVQYCLKITVVFTALKIYWTYQKAQKFL